MTPLARSITHAQRALTLVAVSMLTVGALTGCSTAPSPALTSPTGTWNATGEDSGLLKIHDDGDFSFTDASYNPVDGIDAKNDFNAIGTWKLVSDGTEILFTFAQATQGSFEVTGGAIASPFTSGTISFTNGEETASITFEAASASQ